MDVVLEKTTRMTFRALQHAGFTIREFLSFAFLLSHYFSFSPQKGFAASDLPSAEMRTMWAPFLARHRCQRKIRRHEIVRLNRSGSVSLWHHSNMNHLLPGESERTNGKRG
jgi:hypothetical protein